MDKILTAISFVVLILGFCGCVEDRLIDKPFYGEPTDYLRFSVLHSPMTKSDLNHSQEFGYLTVEEEELSMGKKRDTLQTRAMPNIELDGLDASVSAFLNTDVVGWDCTNKHFIFDYETLEPHSDGDKINWGAVGSAKSMNIYAFSPYPSNTSALTLNVADKTVTYVADVEDPTKHIDVITATAQVEKSMFGRVIPLTFNHALTGLRFKMGFECQVKSLTITNVKNTYALNLSNPSPSVSNPVTFSFTPNKKMKIGEFFNYGESTLMLPPQSFNNETTVTLVYTENGTDRTIQTTLNGKSWSPGKLITYTINKTLSTTGMIYFDLAAGKIELTASTYEGYRFNNGISEVVSGTHSPANTYYVYQSATTNRSATGVTGRPIYNRVTYGGKSWADFITNGGKPIVNNPLFVEEVIHAWDNKTGATSTTEPVTGAVGAVRTAGREGTFNWIKVTGGSTFNLIVDNIYSKYMENGASRDEGGITFIPGSGVSNSTLTIYLEGDNRVGCVHYNGEKDKNNKLVFENYLNGYNGNSPGTLTVADVNYYTGSHSGDYGLPQHSNEGYYGNHWSSAIGSHDVGSGDAHGIAINSGIIFAGTTKAENCSAIGAGGNGSGEVTINGGTVVAIATTTGTAIGGGIGFHSQGGKGTVTIAGGNVYAYNFANRWNIPSSAIGGAGSMEKTGAEGNVTITYGNVYAYSALGTAIGGGSSYSSYGGQATIKITGGVITAKSDAGAGIGGGTGCSSGTTGQYGNTQYYGGNAHIRISGAPIIKTGSVGGGETKAEGSFLGKADIEVSGGDIQAQFIMEATGQGVSNMPRFVMNGGIIHNNNTLSDEFYYIKKYGGAVYMNEGSFTMNDGTIRDCSAEQGGAVYICGDNNPTFSMNGGTIKACKALGNTGSTPTVPNGGGLYLQNGTVTMSGTAEIRECSAQNGGAIYLEGGEVNLYGGKIYNNLVNQGNGGAIYIIGGNFNMSKDGASGGNALIQNNSSFATNNTGGSGGGIYMTYHNTNISANIISGQIRGNSADRLGGGICVDMDEAPADLSAEVTVGEGTTHADNPFISQNKALLEGGGMYVIGNKANIEINNGFIKENITTGYVYNQDIANEGGLVTLKDTNVTKSVVITFDANGGIFDPSTNATTAIQNIVVSTNSLLVGPTYRNLTGKTFVRWHTRADGDNSKGREYHDGDIMNLNANLTLYAIWE